MKTKENSPANGAYLREYSPAETQRRREIQVVQATLLPSTQGRDGSPQPSQVSGATRRHPRRLRLKNRASRRSAPTFVNQVARSTPFVSHSVFSVSSVVKSSSSAFTLLEVLVATAVLALMMTFLFNLLGSSAKIWEIGNKKIEAAQAARVGLNIIAKDLKNAFAGNMTTYNGTGGQILNYACFLAYDSPPNTLNLVGSSTVNGTHQLRAIVSTGDAADPFNEIGLQCVFMTANHASGMAKNKCYLARKKVSYSSSQMYLTSNNTTSLTASSWSFTTGIWSNFAPIIDNCIGLTFNYAYKNGTSIDWTTTPNQTPTSNNFTSLPLGVLVTITVLDSKTAEKIAAIKGNSPLTAPEITNGLSSSSPATLTAVERLIAQGSVTMSRFIPFNAN